MTLFQHVSMWSLRALALWFALEVGLDLYQGALQQAATSRQAAGHREAMSRLQQHEAELQRRWVSVSGRLSANNSSVWRLDATGAPIDVAAARSLRDTLLSLGAEAPVVDARRDPASPGPGRVTLSAHWREGADQSPAVLFALSTRHPSFRVRTLTIERDGNANAAITEIELSTLVEATP